MFLLVWKLLGRLEADLMRPPGMQACTRDAQDVSICLMKLDIPNAGRIRFGCSSANCLTSS